MVYRIAKFSDHRIIAKDRMEFLTEWENYGRDVDSWQPFEEMERPAIALREYYKTISEEEIEKIKACRLEGKRTAKKERAARKAKEEAKKAKKRRRDSGSPMPSKKLKAGADVESSDEDERKKVKKGKKTSKSISDGPSTSASSTPRVKKSKVAESHSTSSGSSGVSTPARKKTVKNGDASSASTTAAHLPPGPTKTDKIDVPEPKKTPRRASSMRATKVASGSETRGDEVKKEVNKRSESTDGRDQFNDVPLPPVTRRSQSMRSTVPLLVPPVPSTPSNLSIPEANKIPEAPRVTPGRSVSMRDTRLTSTLQTSSTPTLPDKTNDTHEPPRTSRRSVSMRAQSSTATPPVPSVTSIGNDADKTNSGSSPISRRAASMRSFPSSSSLLISTIPGTETDETEGSGESTTRASTRRATSMRSTRLITSPPKEAVKMENRECTETGPSSTHSSTSTPSETKLIKINAHQQREKGGQCAKKKETKEEKEEQEIKKEEEEDSNQGGPTTPAPMKENKATIVSANSIILEGRRSRKPTSRMVESREQKEEGAKRSQPALILSGTAKDLEEKTVGTKNNEITSSDDKVNGMDTMQGEPMDTQPKKDEIEEPIEAIPSTAMPHLATKASKTGMIHTGVIDKLEDSTTSFGPAENVQIVKSQLTKKEQTELIEEVEVRDAASLRDAMEEANPPEGAKKREETEKMEDDTGVMNDGTFEEDETDRAERMEGRERSEADSDESNKKETPSEPMPPGENDADKNPVISDANILHETPSHILIGRNWCRKKAVKNTSTSPVSSLTPSPPVIPRTSPEEDDQAESEAMALYLKDLEEIENQERQRRRMQRSKEVRSMEEEEEEGPSTSASCNRREPEEIYGIDKEWGLETEDSEDGEEEEEEEDEDEYFEEDWEEEEAARGTEKARQKVEKGDLPSTACNESSKGEDEQQNEVTEEKKEEGIEMDDDEMEIMRRNAGWKRDSDGTFILPPTPSMTPQRDEEPDTQAIDESVNPRVEVEGMTKGTILGEEEEEIIVLRKGELPAHRPPILTTYKEMKREEHLYKRKCTQTWRIPPKKAITKKQKKRRGGGKKKKVATPPSPVDCEAELPELIPTGPWPDSSRVWIDIKSKTTEEMKLDMKEKMKVGVTDLIRKKGILEVNVDQYPAFLKNHEQPHQEGEIAVSAVEERRTVKRKVDKTEVVKPSKIDGRKTELKNSKDVRKEKKSMAGRCDDVEEKSGSTPSEGRERRSRHFHEDNKSSSAFVEPVVVIGEKRQAEEEKSENGSPQKKKRSITKGRKLEEADEMFDQVPVKKEKKHLGETALTPKKKENEVVRLRRMELERMELKKVKIEAEQVRLFREKHETVKLVRTMEGKKRNTEEKKREEMTPEERKAEEKKAELKKQRDRERRRMIGDNNKFKVSHLKKEEAKMVQEKLKKLASDGRKKGGFDISIRPQSIPASTPLPSMANSRYSVVGVDNDSSYKVVSHVVVPPEKVIFTKSFRLDAKQLEASKDKPITLFDTRTFAQPSASSSTFSVNGESSALSARVPRPPTYRTRPAILSKRGESSSSSARNWEQPERIVDQRTSYNGVDQALLQQARNLLKQGTPSTRATADNNEEEVLIEQSETPFSLPIRPQEVLVNGKPMIEIKEEKMDDDEYAEHVKRMAERGIERPEKREKR